MAISAMALLAMVGASIDFLYAEKMKADLQVAVDAAALAGALEDKQSEQVKSANVAFQNNFSHDDTIVPRVQYVDPNLVVTATMEKDRLMPVLGGKTMTVSVAAIATATEGDSPCIHILDPSGPRALRITISGTISSQCPIQVNSSHANAFNYVGSGTYDVAATYVVGGASVTSSGTVVNQPETNAAVKPDPLQGLAAPNTSAMPCDYTNESVITSSMASVNPGVYCGGLKIIGSGSINMMPGQYVMRNGTFDVVLSGSLNGDNIFIVLEGDSEFDVAANGNSRLSAPTTGPYGNILVFQDRSSLNKVEFKLTLSGDQEYIGKIYAPRANLEWAISGSMKQPSKTPLIVNRLNIAKSGFGEFSIEPTEVQAEKFSRLIR